MSEEEVKDVESEEEVHVEDATNMPLNVAKYLNPPERPWVLYSFIGMFVFFFGYYYLRYAGHF